MPANNAAPPGGQVGVKIAPPLKVNPTATAGTANISSAPVDKAVFDKSKAVALPGAEEIAARNKAAAASPSNLEAINPETLTSSPEDKKQSIEKAKEVSKQQQAEHLYVPVSALQSGTATPAATQEEVTPEAGATEKHRGSDVVEAPKEDIKKVEGETSLREEEEEGVSKGVADLNVGEDTKTQEQDPKDSEAASASVQD